MNFPYFFTFISPFSYSTKQIENLSSCTSKNQYYLPFRDFVSKLTLFRQNFDILLR